MNSIYSLIITFLLFCFIHTEFKIEEITFKNEETRFDNLTENKYYHIKPEYPSNLTNYTKLVVRDNNATSKSHLNYINYAISYYQDDETFSNRKQLSYGSLNTTTMWLKEEQIKNGFYISIESTYDICNFSLEIYPKNKAELLRGEQYSYYVTEENKEMKFYINNKNFLEKNTNFEYITFWVKGIDNNDIDITLKGNYSNFENDYQKHSKYNAYIIKAQKLKYFEFEITIKGKPGDLITIGNLACSQSCKIDYFYSGQELFGFLIKGIGVQCFDEDLFKNNDYEFGACEDNLYKEIHYYGTQSCSYNPEIGKTECIPYRCLQIPSTFNELLYTMKSNRYYYPQSNNGIIGNNYKLHSLSYGLNYSFYLQQNESIRLFPLYFENFNYLTYHLKSEHINNVSIFNCDNYPLCTLSPNNNSQNTPIQRAYGSYSFSFHKNEIPNWSPIGKNQKLLMVTCYNSTLRQKSCENLVRIYTDKSSLFLTSSRKNEYMIIRKGNMDKLAIYDLTYVSIETLTGNITIDFDKNTT